MLLYWTKGWKHNKILPPIAAPLCAIRYYVNYDVVSRRLWNEGVRVYMQACVYTQCRAMGIIMLAAIFIIIMLIGNTPDNYKMSKLNTPSLEDVLEHELEVNIVFKQ